LFAAAVELSLADRTAFLDRECAADDALRQQLDALLKAHDRASHLLDRPPVQETLGAAATPSETPDLVGTTIAGRYKLLEEIGEGGMGSVWVAEQLEPVHRKVALKLIKPGMDSRSVLARFEAERQALAVMDHPSIAKVLDGGLTEAGRPYFVMEYVKGVPITEYCDAVRLSVADRLNLFVQVCSAVQHAHQKGIIHRDLKPSNILVAPYDDKPVPKVIDFGLAKALHQRLTDRTLHTAHETVIGTPLYMSPEQAQLNNLDVDTRTDIYSLGVLLYELLTGTTPLEKARFKEAAWDEIRRLIRDEEPPRPSTRLSSSSTLPSLAACRQTEPLKLTQQLRGDLDWIIMKALEKDRTRRYETTIGLPRTCSDTWMARRLRPARRPSATDCGSSTDGTGRRCFQSQRSLSCCALEFRSWPGRLSARPAPNAWPSQPAQPPGATVIAP
jgi:serine/threonine protein kinase